ncbi:MAG: protein translocase subunit SecD [Acidimicrobiia bacterium]
MNRPWIGVLVMLALSWGGLAALLLNGTTPKLGLDLQGGISVVLTAPDGTETDKLEVAADIIRRRIEEIGGVQEPDIAPSGGNALTPPNILVQLPGITDEARALEAVGATGSLSFRPVLGATFGEVGPLANGGAVPVEHITVDTYNRCYELPGGTIPETTTPVVDPVTGLTVDDDATVETYLPYEGQVLHLGPAIVDGTQVSQALSNFQNQWLVQLDLTAEGGERFACMTGQATAYFDARRQIAIVLDGDIQTAPPVSTEVGPEGIDGGSAVITVGSDASAEQEARDLAVVLRYGSLPVSFELSDVSQVSGTLGADSLRIGVISGLAGLILVAVFLLVFYRALGVVAIVGLLTFGAALVALLALLGESLGVSLTLAGITGIIISVGTTADSYIVYFERIKDEVREGLDPATATVEGFKDAYRTIITANTVSLLAAGLLYALAVGPVRGFALALGIATLLGLFITKVFTRRAAYILASSRLGDGGWFSIAGAAKYDEEES